jgi:hypothetical protein
VSYASFTNSPASTKVPAHSMAGRTIPAGAGKNRMAALLALAASAQFVLVAFAAYSAAVLYHRLVGGSPPDRQHDDDATLPVPSHPLQPSIRHRRRSRWTRCRQPPVHHRSDRNQARSPRAVLFQQKRLQQRAHSPAELQINDREGGRRQFQACHQTRPTGDPTGTLHTPYNIDELPPLFNVLVRVVSIDGGFWQRWSIVAWSCFAQRLPAKHLMPKRLVAMPIDAAPASFANRTSPHTTRASSRSLNYQQWK